MVFTIFNPSNGQTGRSTASFDQAKAWADASPGLCVVLGSPNNVVYQSQIVCVGCGG